MSARIAYVLTKNRVYNRQVIAEYKMKVVEILQKDVFWSAISAVAAMVATFAALYTIKMAKEAAELERLSKRAYFTVSKPGIKQISDGPPFRIQITLENVGSNPTCELTGKILFVGYSLKDPPDSQVELSVANEIPSNSPTPWYYDSLDLPKDMPSKYIVLLIKYFDPIIDRYYEQQFYMKWHGVKDGITYPDCSYYQRRKGQSY